MDMVMGLMLTCVALFQEVESPLGHVAAFDPPSGEQSRDATPSAFARQANQRRRAMQDSIADGYRVFERAEPRRRGPTRNEVYMGLRRLAGGRREERR